MIKEKKCRYIQFKRKEITYGYPSQSPFLHRGVTEQLTLAERGKFYENLIPILRVDYSCAYNNLLERIRFLGNKK